MLQYSWKPTINKQRGGGVPYKGHRFLLEKIVAIPCNENGSYT